MALETALCDTIVGALDADVLVAGRGGRLVYANPKARARIGGAGDGTPLGQIFADWDDEIRQTLTRAAQSNQWVPVNLGLWQQGGLETIRFRARGIRQPGSGETLLLLMADRRRDQGFAQLRTLIRDLNSELADRRHTQTQLQRALDSEERLHKELIHRVKNNLSLLSALISYRRNATNDPDIREALSDLEQRVRAIAAVHELLDRAGEVDFGQAGELIRALCHQLETSLLPDHVAIENDLLDISLNVVDATPLSLLVNELIINAVKHAFPDGRRGTVTVGLKKNGVDKLEVSVADDGRGMDPADGRRTGSGSRIVSALAHQIGGTLERHHDRAGTHWSFIFPYRDAGRGPDRGTASRPTQRAD